MFENDLSFARNKDREDPLHKFKSQFLFPKNKQGEELIYFCGNSLGLQPKRTSEFIRQELEDWANLGVKGHTNARHPWMPYHEFLSNSMANIVGAKPGEVVIMNSLTANLHFMMVSFYRPTSTKYKIIIEKDAFPSDKYAVESQLKYYGFDPNDGLILWHPNEDDELYRFEDLEQIMDDQGEEVALIMIGNTNYYNGQAFPIDKITHLGHQYGCKVGFDLAHGAGNVPVELHKNGADFAVWCTYKYLNSGPGSLGGCFVHERHALNRDLKRFTGWWGHNKKTRFNMRNDFDVLPGAEGWQLSNPSILSLAAIRASLDVFEEAGFEKLVTKSKQLTGYLEFLIEGLNNEEIRIITPNDPEQRGCQLSLKVRRIDRTLHQKLTEASVISDWREPDVIRVAPAPLYNSFEEVFHFVERLKKILNG